MLQCIIPVMSGLERKKLIEAIVFFSQHTKWCGATKLFKLLFFLDMLHFRETGRSVTGLNYTAWPMGPVPVPLFEELRTPQPDLAEKVEISNPPHDETEGASKLTRIAPKHEWEDKYLTVREKRIASELAEIFSDAKADEMSNVSHAKGGPWDRARDKNPGKWVVAIEYLDSLSPTLKMGSGAARGKEELRQRAEELKEDRQLFK